MSKIRLLHMLVQPILALEDDDGNLKQIEEPVRRIESADWPRYSGETFPRELDEAQATLDTQEAGKAPKTTQTATHTLDDGSTECTDCIEPLRSTAAHDGRASQS